MTVLVAGALVGPGLLRMFHPQRVADSHQALRMVALLGLAQVGAYLLARRLGPLAVGRADLAWLLPTPVSRRGLLVPGLVRVAAGFATLGAAAGVLAAVRLRVGPGGTHLAACAVAGAACWLLSGLVTAYAQRSPAAGWWTDAAALVAAVPLVAVLLDERVADWAPVYAGLRHAVPAGWALLPTDTVGWLAIVTGTAALVGLATVVFTLDTFPLARLSAPTHTAGALSDAVYAVQPSFLAELRERHYWQRQALRSRRLRRFGRLPVPVTHDLLVLWRSGTRLAWWGAAALAPAALAGTAWLSAGALLLGALSVAAITADATRRDAANPALLRLAGLTGRQVLVGRLLVPAVLATLWSTVALAAAAWWGDLPPGPWWALGAAFGPLAAVAAVRRARAGMVDNGLPLVDTPMGSFAPGPLIWLAAGPDVLALLGLPALLLVLGGHAPGWTSVLVQAVLTVTALAVYAWKGADRRRGEF